jgi:hypothetical protein
MLILSLQLHFGCGGSTLFKPLAFSTRPLREHASVSAFREIYPNGDRLSRGYGPEKGRTGLKKVRRMGKCGERKERKKSGVQAARSTLHYSSLAGQERPRGGRGATAGKSLPQPFRIAAAWFAHPPENEIKNSLVFL